MGTYNGGERSKKTPTFGRVVENARQIIAGLLRSHAHDRDVHRIVTSDGRRLHLKLAHSFHLVLILAIVFTTASLQHSKNVLTEREEALAHPPLLRIDTSVDTPSSDVAAADEQVRLEVDFFDDSDSPPRNEVNIAYFLQLSEASLPLVPRLLKNIHHTDNVYMLHVDGKASQAVYDSFRNEVEAEPAYAANVHFLERESVIYRGISMVSNTLSGMLKLLDVPGWQYFINLSGADYPMVSAKQQRRLLASSTARPIFMDLFPRYTWQPFFKYRVGHIYVDPSLVLSPHKNLHLFFGPAGKIPHNPLCEEHSFEVAKAEAWMMAPRDFVEHAARSGVARRLLSYLVNMCSSPEHFFVTLALEHPDFRQVLVETGFRTVLWKDGNRSTGQHPVMLDDTKRNPDIMRQWPNLMKARGFFARKFSKTTSVVMDGIDKQCLNEERLENNEYLRSVRDHFAEVTKDVRRRLSSAQARA